MASMAEMRVLPSRLSFKVLQLDPSVASAAQAVRGVRRYLERRRAGLAQALEVEAEGAEVVIRARGEAPDEMIREAHELLGLADAAPSQEIEVDPAEFAVEVTEAASPEPQLEHEILKSKVRHFAYPVCEWFDVSTGLLVLSNQRIVYEPEAVIMADDHGGSADAGVHVIPLAEVRRVYRGEWWDVPCLMVETAGRTYRYGWPAERGEPETVFEVDEWIAEIRFLI
jgi:hypothetical protein